MRFSYIYRTLSSSGSYNKSILSGIMPFSLICLVAVGLFYVKIWISILEVDTGTSGLSAQRYNYDTKDSGIGSNRKMTAVVVNWQGLSSEKTTEYELQHWTEGWLSSWKSADGSLIVTDTHAIIHGLSTVDTLGFRIRSRIKGWMVWNSWFDDTDWGPWSEPIYLPPTNNLRKTKDFNIFNSVLIISGVVLSLSILFCLCNSRRQTGFVRLPLGNSCIDPLLRRIEELQQDLDDAESEVRSLMRLKGHGIHSMGIEELRLLEEELEIGLKAIRREKESLLLNDHDRHLCVICRSEDKTVLLLPCRHLCLCHTCTKRTNLSSCPVCRGRISKTVNVFA